MSTGRLWPRFQSKESWGLCLLPCWSCADTGGEVQHSVGGGRKEAEGCRENLRRSLVKEEAESERGRRALAAYSSFTHRETEREALLDVFHLEMSQTGT